MFQGKWRIWNMSIFVLVLLTIYNIFLTIRLMYSTSCTQNGDIPLKLEHKLVQTSNCDNRNLPNHLDDASNKRSEKILNKTLRQNIEVIYKELQTNQKYSLNLNLDLGRSDNRLSYKLFDNIIVGDKYVQLTKDYKTCLATQSSLEKIASIIESSLYWAHKQYELELVTGS
ncbi:hypothetical protein GWI33_006123 [Rhynchophorus ferrugineus]|uniref:Uncharacterized protein n=1 Tax=Rhynchophorus ferrugineus TaxID=354439 RepID=A0A834IV59_RHYFE|nr:hypothetical protein GWI33_006123 [Rhynchophorus ferrugineus]